MRRPQRFGNLAAVCGTTNERLLEIVNKFRGTDELFLTPYLPAPIGEDTVVDVGHEALIRGWDRIAAKYAGWHQQEFRDARASAASSARAFAFQVQGQRQSATAFGGAGERDGVWFDYLRRLLR